MNPVLQEFRRAEIGFSAIIQARGAYGNKRVLDENFKITEDPRVSELPAVNRFVQLLESNAAAILPTLSEERAQRIYRLFLTFAQDTKGLHHTTFVELGSRVGFVLHPLIDRLKNNIERILQKAPAEITKQEADLLHEKLVSCALNRELVETICLFGAIKEKKSISLRRSFNLGVMAMDEPSKKVVMDREIEENEDKLTAKEIAFLMAIQRLGIKLALNKVTADNTHYKDLVSQILDYQERHPERSDISERFLMMLDMWQWMSYDTNVNGLHGWLTNFPLMIAPNVVRDQKDPAWARFCDFGGVGLKFHDSFAEFNSKVLTYQRSKEYHEAQTGLVILCGKAPSKTSVSKIQSKLFTHLEKVAEMERDFRLEVDQLYNLYKSVEVQLIDEYNSIATVLKLYRNAQAKPIEHAYLANLPSQSFTLKKVKELPETYLPINRQELIPKTVREQTQGSRALLKEAQKKPTEDDAAAKLQCLKIADEKKACIVQPPVSEGKKIEFSYDDRISRWYDPAQDPFSHRDYRNQTLSQEKKRFIRVQHAFDRIVDKYIINRGSHTTEPGLSRDNPNKRYSLAGALKIDGKLYRGRYSICINLEGSIYLHQFEEETDTKNPKQNSVIKKQMYKIDFQALEKIKLQKREERKRAVGKFPTPANATAEVIKESSILIEIKDYLNQATYYLYPDPH